MSLTRTTPSTRLGDQGKKGRTKIWRINSPSRPFRPPPTDSTTVPGTELATQGDEPVDRRVNKVSSTRGAAPNARNHLGYEGLLEKRASHTRHDIVDQLRVHSSAGAPLPPPFSKPEHGTWRWWSFSASAIAIAIRALSLATGGLRHRVT